MFSFTQQLYAITDVHASGLSHTEQVRRLTTGGADLIQLREKHLSARQFFTEATEALQVARSRGARVVINDRVDMALALGADGVHLGQTDLSPTVARKLLGADAIIGFSTHNLEQAQSAVRMPVDYIAIGPIFPTATKDDPDPVVGLDGLREVRRVCQLPLVAIGGITEQNAAEVIGAGADAVAIIRSLLTAPQEIEARTAALLSRLQIPRRP
jgi:thiamine-phosphate pyrophosphorylase